MTYKRLKYTSQAEEITKYLSHKVHQFNLVSVQEMNGAGALLNAIFGLKKRTRMHDEVP